MSVPTWSLRIFAIVLALTAAGCSDKDEPVKQPADDAGSSTTRAKWSELRDGFWLSRGHGYVFDIEEGHFVWYDITKRACVRNMEGAIQDLETMLGADVALSADRRSFRAEPPVTLMDYEFDRLDTLPDACKTAPPDDPVTNFEILWHTFDENYAFFAERRIDWKAMYDTHRPKVGPGTTREELFTIFRDMLAPLRDGHVGFGDESASFVGEQDSRLFRGLAEEVRNEPGKRSVPEIVFARREEHLALLREKYLGEDARTAANQIVYKRRLDARRGYLGIHGMAGFGTDPSDERAALQSALDEALTALADVESLVVDVRFNFGGSDALQLEIAKRFADQRRLVFTASARHGDGYTTPQEFFVEPAGAVRFTKPVTLLVSPITFSAAETFVLSMRVLPSVTVVGERTGGGFSDVLAKQLPNGWRFSLSNERFIAADGKLYEGVGVPPNVEVLFWTPEELANKTDATLEYVLAH